MHDFEALGLSPELVEALAAEGIETPTVLQSETIPVLRKGHGALIRGAPGAGILVAWAAPLLDRIEPAQGGPVIIALVPTRDAAVGIARSLGRVAAATGHRTAALEGPFALPGHADLIVATPEALRRAMSAGDLATDRVRALVVAGAAALLADDEVRGWTEEIVEVVGEDDCQRVVVADPVTEPVRSFVGRHLSRAVHLPSDAARDEAHGASPVERGVLRVRALDHDETTELPALVDELLAEEHRHLLLFFRSADRAADLGDLLTLHGFMAGAPGDPDAPIWLATGGLEAKDALEEAGASVGEGVLVVSVDVPPDPDELDRRHRGAASAGVVFARNREIAHLRGVAAEAGYRLDPFPPSGARVDAAIRFADGLSSVIEDEDLEAYHLLVEGAVARWGAGQVAAALALLLKRRGKLPDGRAAEHSGLAATGGASASEGAPRATGAPPPAIVRLFLSVGSRDGIGAGELLGAITGESGIRGDQVGRIDVRDTFSRVEVEEAVARTVLRAMNGISVRGRSVRADYDRGADRSQRRPPPRGRS